MLNAFVFENPDSNCWRLVAKYRPTSLSAVPTLLAARVDEAPAKPKSVTVIDSMPMTNVGKIYKPDLRTLAALKVVITLVDETGDRLLLGDTNRPHVQRQSDGFLQLQIDKSGCWLIGAPTA